jgi:hypothetical protein
MTELTKQVDTIMIKLDQPTELTFSDLYTWVIWQYPRQVEKGLCGAVRPPLPEHGWLPAVIRLKEKVVLVHGHVDKSFSYPAAAADWVAESLKSPSHRE